MRRSLMTVKIASFTMAISLASLANGHDMAPSPHAHAVQSYDGTHSVNSKPVSGRQMRMYRGGAALVPESEQHVLGLINIYDGDTGTRPAVNDPYMNEEIGKGMAEGVSQAALGEASQTLGNKDGATDNPDDSDSAALAKATSSDPVYEAFRKWCDLQLQPSMSQEEWEIVRTNTMPEGMSCEMK
jgi:hypothetical protein